MEASHAPPWQANKAPGGLGPIKVPRPSLACQAATTGSAGSLVPSAQPGHSAGLPALPLQRTCWHPGRVCRMWLRAGLAAPVCSPGWPHLQNFLWPSPECQSHSGLPRDRRNRLAPLPGESGRDLGPGAAWNTPRDLPGHGGPPSSGSPGSALPSAHSPESSGASVTQQRGQYLPQPSAALQAHSKGCHVRLAASGTLPWSLGFSGDFGVSLDIPCLTAVPAIRALTVLGAGADH